jgi:predicted esterase YcpF (UPF0227 family)
MTFAILADSIEKNLDSTHLAVLTHDAHNVHQLIRSTVRQIVGGKLGGFEAEQISTLVSWANAEQNEKGVVPSACVVK